MELGKDRFEFILISLDNIRLLLTKATEHFLSEIQNLEGYSITAKKDNQFRLTCWNPIDGSKTKKRFPIIDSNLPQKIVRL